MNNIYRPLVIKNKGARVQTGSVKISVVLIVLIGIIGVAYFISKSEPDIGQDNSKSDTGIKISDSQVKQLREEVVNLVAEIEKERKNLAALGRDGLQQNRPLKSGKLDHQSKPQLTQGESESKAVYRQAVIALADKVVFESTAYMNTSKHLENASRLIKNRDSQEAFDILHSIKTTLNATLEQVGRVGELISEGFEVHEARRKWLITVKKQAWQLLPTVVEIEDAYQAIRLVISEGRFANAIETYPALLNKYNDLQRNGDQLIAAQERLEGTRKAWDQYLKKNNLSRIAQSESLVIQNEKYLETVSSGRFSASVIAAKKLEERHKILLSNLKNAQSNRKKANNAKQFWESYAAKEGLVQIPQSLKLSEKLKHSIESDFHMGNFENAEISFKNISNDYKILGSTVKTTLKFKEKAEAERSQFKTYEYKDYVDSKKIELARSLYNLSNKHLNKGELEQANQGYQKSIIHWQNLMEQGVVAESKARRQAMIPTMVSIPGNRFNMGDLNNKNDDEKPVHEVNVSPFKMSQHEITQAQWIAVMGFNPSFFKGDNLPVEQVSWEDIQVYLKKLNAIFGEKFRLPSEAEWEYSARAGSATSWSWGDDESSTDYYAWYGKNSANKTHDVGKKNPNDFGLYDMHGNVYEWVQDCWNDNYKGAPKDGKGWKSGDCEVKVMRGGAWFSGSEVLRSANRYRGHASLRDADIGFRIVQD